MLAQELFKYKLLNIFYNHEKEIEMLQKLELGELKFTPLGRRGACKTPHFVR